MAVTKLVWIERNVSIGWKALQKHFQGERGLCVKLAFEQSVMFSTASFTPDCSPFPP